MYTGKDVRRTLNQFLKRQEWETVKGRLILDVRILETHTTDATKRKIGGMDCWNMIPDGWMLQQSTDYGPRVLFTVNWTVDRFPERTVGRAT